MKQQSPDQSSRFMRSHQHPVILRTLGMMLATAVLLMVARIVTTASCWMVFVLICLVAWPLWQYRTEYLLFRRRLVLSGTARPTSRLRAFLWRGGLTRGIQAVVSMFLAWVLLALVSTVSPLHWSVFAVDAIFLSLIAGPITRQLEGDIKARHTGIIARRWPLFLINGVVLSVAVMLLDFFITGATDTRHLDWQTLAGQAFTQSSNHAGCVLWGMSAGAVAVLEALSWHFSEMLIPGLPGLPAKIIAWSFFLLRAVTVAWLYTMLLLGICVFLDRREERRQGRMTDSDFSRSFFLTIILLALPFFYVSIKLNEVDARPGREAVNETCKPDEASRAQLLMRLDSALASERLDAIHQVDNVIDQGLVPVFADIEAGVEAYLDWYFTVIGEYQRLTAVFTTDAVTAMSLKLEEYLFTNTDFAKKLDDLDHTVGALSAARFAGIPSSLDTELENSLCTIGTLDLARIIEIDRDNLRASAALTSGVGAGIVASKLLAQKTAAAVVGKVAAKKSFHAGAAVITKTLAKKGTSTALSAGLGVTVCAPAGPAAILCGITAGLVTWLAVDKALIELDESLHREEMRADILAVLAEQQGILATQLRQKHYLQVDHHVARISSAVKKTFIPYNDGMGGRRD